MAVPMAGAVSRQLVGWWSRGACGTPETGQCGRPAPSPGGAGTFWLEADRLHATVGWPGLCGSGRRGRGGPWCGGSAPSVTPPLLWSPAVQDASLNSDQAWPGLLGLGPTAELPRGLDACLRPRRIVYHVRVRQDWEDRPMSSRQGVLRAGCPVLLTHLP